MIQKAKDVKDLMKDITMNMMLRKFIRSIRVCSQLNASCRIRDIGLPVNKAETPVSNAVLTSLSSKTRLSNSNTRLKLDHLLMVQDHPKSTKK